MLINVMLIKKKHAVNLCKKVQNFGKLSFQKRFFTNVSVKGVYFAWVGLE